MALVVERNCAIKSSRLLVVIDRRRSMRSSSKLDRPGVDDIGSESTSMSHGTIGGQKRRNEDLKRKNRPEIVLTSVNKSSDR